MSISYRTVKSFSFADLCEPNDILPGSCGMIDAEFAKKLVTKDPGLASPDRKDELMEAIDKVYCGEHAVEIQLDERDIASVKMQLTHEDDLPQS